MQYAIVFTYLSNQMALPIPTLTHRFGLLHLAAKGETMHTIGVPENGYTFSSTTRLQVLTQAVIVSSSEAGKPL